MLENLKFSQPCTRIFHDAHYVAIFSRDHNESIVPSPDNAHEHTETIQYRLVCIHMVDFAQA